MSSNRGWPIFLVGLLLSIFFGGAIRVIVSPQKVRIWIDELVSRKQPKFTLEYASARLTLADGFLPSLAIEFDELQIQAKDKCLSGSEIKIKRTNVPLQLSDLFNKKLKLGRLTIEGAEYRYRPVDCPERMPTELKIKDFMSRRWAREIENTYKILAEVSVTELKIFLQEEVEPRAVLKDFDFLFKPESKSMEFVGQVLPGYEITGGQPLGALKAKGKITNEQLEFEGRGSLKEGQYSHQLSWNIDTDDFISEFKIKDFPLENSLFLMNRWQFLDVTNFKPKNEWVTCDIQIKGRLFNWNKSLADFNNCLIYGDLGLWRVRAGKIALLNKELYPIWLDIQKLNVKKLLEAIKFEQALNLLAQSGSMELTFESLAKNQYSAKGTWNNIVFQIKSPNGLISTEPITQLQFDTDIHAQSFSFRSRSIAWPKGKADGVLQLDRDLFTDLWRMSWDISAQSSPDILNNYFSFDKINNLKTSGEYEQLSDSAYEYKSRVQFDLAKSDNIEFGPSRIDIEWKSQVGKIKSEVSTLKFLAQDKWKSLNEIIDNQELQNIILQLQFDRDNKWQILSATANQTNFRYELFGRGYNRVFDLAKLRQIAANTNVAKEWSILGNISEPQLEAEP